MMLSFAMKIMMLALLMIFTSVEAFRSYSAMLGPLHGSRHRLYSTLDMPLTAQDIASIRQASKIVSKQEALELSPMKVRAVPALAHIQSSARSSSIRGSQQRSTRKLTEKAGGYPTQNVKDSLYLNLYVLMQHTNNKEQQRTGNSVAKRRHKEELETFGLV
mmetsp:Transcript_5191/g.8404  ORF Transcript_5191/g.8404 Transcript_5191/m.8404 type:complete len:161 (+) Transcript_5191:45-527(+)